MFSSWLSKCSANKERLLEDVEALMETSKQTSFLYTLAHQLYKHLGTELETRVIFPHKYKFLGYQQLLFDKT